MVAAVTRVELVLDSRAALGEGPCWLADRQRLLWVDILAGQVHLLDPETAEDRAIPAGQPVGAAVPADDGRVVLALQDGFALLDPGSGKLERLADVERDRPDNRMNDGKCDCAGRFWAGTMAVDERTVSGALYRLEAGRVTRVLDGVGISNGLGWSLDDARMYYVDTPTARVDVFDFDPVTGTVANRRPLLQVEGHGKPDGMTVDAGGSLWVALWGGWRILHVLPDGSVAGAVQLPVSQVTSCCFGGPDLGDLYVTTARKGLSPERLAAEPLAGGIFRCRPGAEGLPVRPYRTR
jgi:sugar lactone lactonase YvrE